MKKHTLILACVALSSLWFMGRVDAAEGETYELTLTPAKYVAVNGDVNKFRAHHWMDNGYTGGIKNLSFDKEYENETTMSFQGHLFPDVNNNGLLLNVNNADFGNVDLEYNSFRKYFDDSGGFYEPFSTLDTNDLNQNLELDIHDLALSFSPSFWDLNGITFLYERRVKHGDKSRLSWAEAREGALRREITPSWQSIDEEVNAVAVKGETEISGVNLSAEHRYELMDMHTIRYEKWLSTSMTASERKQRMQDQQPRTEVFTTTFQGNKWFSDDTAYTNVAYRYSSLDNEEVENIIEADEFGNPMNFSNAKTRTNATASNDVDSHTLVGHYMKMFTKAFKVTAKAKAQYYKRKSESIYPYDTSPAVPDGNIDDIDYSISRNKLVLFGQNFAFQYTGIKKLSLYGDIELNEMENDMKETQLDFTRSFDWERFTEAKTKKSIYTLGGRYIPSRYFNMTLQGRHRLENNDYDDLVDTSGSINSAFVDSMKIIGDEITTKLTWKPLRWLHNSFRYQFDRKNYETRVQDLSGKQVGRYLSHTFTYDIFMQPRRDLLFNFAYTLQDAKVSTPADASSDAASLPGFNADVQSIMASASYTPNEELGFTTAITKTMSDNFNDFTSSALPLGVSNNYYTAELSMNWRPKDKNWSIEPHYGYYHYDTSSVAEFGNYIAHVAWLDVNIDW